MLWKMFIPSTDPQNFDLTGAGDAVFLKNRWSFISYFGNNLVEFHLMT